MPRVLLVDDDPDILETLRFALEHEGFEVEVAQDGLTALRAARLHPPAVAVLDVMLPGMNGYDVSRYLKQDMRGGRLPHFGIVMLTARQVHSSARQDFLATWSQADVSMWKPFDLVALIDRIHQLASAGVDAPAHSGGPA
jgi:two-component system, OmpR family, response regulator